MSETSKAITDHIKGKDYPKKPFDVQETAVRLGVPQVVNDLDGLHKVEKQAMSRDMLKDDDHFLNDPVGRLREITQTDLLFLMNAFLGFKDVSPKSKYIRELNDFYNAGYMRMCTVVPRWHLKTTFGAGFITRHFLKNPNDTWMVESATDKLAQEIFELTQSGMLTQPMHLIWGNLRLNPIKPKWGGKELNISLRTDFTNRSPSLYWKGVNAEATGQHPDNGLFDDISAELNCETPEQRQKVKERYDRKKLVVKKIHLHNATRWHFDDVIGYIEEKNKEEDYDSPIKYHFFKRSVYEDNGEVLFPELYPREWVENLRRDLGAYLFATQMMNNPIPEEDQIFRPEWVEPYYYDSLDSIKDLLPTMDFYLTWDPGSTDKKSGDYNAFVVCGVTPRYDIYVVDYTRTRASVGELIRIFFDLAEKWKVRVAGIEQGAYEKTYKRDIKEMMKVRGTFFSMRKLRYGQQPGSRSRAKKDRNMSLQPLFENGCIHIGKWMHELQDEVIFYDAYKFDDGVDALAYQRQIIKIPREKTEKKEKTWIEKHRERTRRGFTGGLRGFVNREQ
jgi:predicted phage terminase large subunit-like protein